MTRSEAEQVAEAAPVTSPLARLRDEVETAGGVRKWAKAHNFSPSFISHVLTGRDKMSDRLAEALDFRRVEFWQDLR